MLMQTSGAIRREIAKVCFLSEGGAFFSLAPLSRGEGRGEGLPPGIRLAEKAPHPALRADLSPQSGAR
jgi:hypothetical protein